jgi:putative DNA primase/helicase
MAGEFGKWPLIDKTLCAVTDARLGARTDTAAVAETMLSISGGDPQTINRKMRSFWNGYLKIRFLITTNDLPRINDASGTLPSRFVLLRMTESFYGREDLDLKEKLRAELPGILNWALAGLKRLRQRGRFKMPKSSSDALQQLEELASPVTAFLREWCVVDPHCEISVEDLYSAYKVWCETAGHRPASVHVLGKDLRQLLPKLVVTRPRTGTRRRHYLGLKLSDDGHEQYDDAIRQRQRR